MTLLITVFAAVISTVLWYQSAPQDIYKLSGLCFMYWGASLMWLVDGVYEYLELGAYYFRPEPAEMLNDGFLGLSVAVLGLVIWVVSLLIRDPKGVLWKKITK